MYQRPVGFSRCSPKNFSDLNGEEVVCAAGWIYGFKWRHIFCGKVSGEGRAVDCEATDEWHRPRDSDVFIADDTAFLQVDYRKSSEF
jgi:hypothetical protein